MGRYDSSKLRLYFVTKSMEEIFLRLSVPQLAKIVHTLRFIAGTLHFSLTGDTYIEDES